MILVLTPLPLERDELNRHGFRSNDVRVLCAGHGKVEFALKTLSAIREMRPELVICAGSAGALAENVGTLDVVVAERTVEHDFQLKFVERPLPSFPGDADTIARLKSSAMAETVHFGTIASGDEDVVDKSRAQEIFKNTGALAVAWEGAGGARACAMERVCYVEIRAITDIAGSDSVANFRKNLPEAMARLADIIKSISR